MFRVRQQLGCSEEVVLSCGQKGITVALLDTGIAGHPDFEHRMVAFRDLVSQRNAFYDDSGHGTHVAGCISGSGRLSGGKYRGIAPYSRLVVGKVLDEKGDGRITDMIRGIEWILSIRETYDIRILNLSIGIGSIRESRPRMKQLLEMIEEAWRAGLVVVCAAGNSGPAEMTLSPIGACKSVITVGCNEGGYFGNRKDLCESYSSRGPSPYDLRKPDLVAPGTDIISCNAFFRKRGWNYQNAYSRKSGTSMATPIVSGAAALLLQKHPDYDNEMVKRKLILSAKDLNEPWNKQGAGLLQINSLLT